MGFTDDRFKASLARLVSEAELDGGNEALQAVVAGIPFAGGPISSLLNGAAKRRVIERAQEVFEAVRERLENVEKAKIDEEYFKSEDFMTVLLLAIEQLQTTHDKMKLQMIANALANAGAIDFSSDSRKELFMRTMRDLSPQHVSMLVSLRPHRAACEQVNPTGDRRTVLQSLAAYGLVDESFEKEEPRIPGSDFRSQREAERAVARLIAAPMKQHFRLSDFGEDFLKFFDSPDGIAESDHPA